MFVVNQSKGQIFKNKVTGICIAGTADYKNIIRLEYINQYGEKSYRKFTFRQVGKNVFHTREEAEKALEFYESENN